MKTSPVTEGISPALRRFCHVLLSKGIIPSAEDPEAVADEFREFFQLPCPMVVRDSTFLLNELDYREVYLQKGFEHENHVRGNWIVYRRVMKIIVDAEPPCPRWIKTLLHEIIEPFLKISYDLSPSAPRLTESEQEKWGRRFAAMVKMPATGFPPTAIDCGLDVVALKDRYSDTLAGVARQIRDLVMAKRVFYFARFDLINNPDRHCPRLIPWLNESKGICVQIRDAARTMQLNRGNGALPYFNLGGRMQYKFITPELRNFIDSRRPILVERVPGGSGWKDIREDLLGENELAVLLRHYGLKRTQGFLMLAVHWKDIHMLQPQLDRVSFDRIRRLDWLFSMQTDSYDAGPTDDIQLPLSESEEDGYNLEQLPMRWPGLAEPMEYVYDTIGQGLLFKGSATLN